MPLVASYSFDFDRVIPSTDDATEVTNGMVWNLVHSLLGLLGTYPNGGNWTCAGSGNGSSGGMDGTNRWWNSGTFSSELMPYNVSPAMAHGWMCLKSPITFPGGPVWLTLDHASPVAGSVDYGHTNWTVWMSTTAPAGGSGTARPTAPASEIGLYWSGQSSIERQSMRFGSANTTSRNCHLILADDGAFLWSANTPSQKLSCGFGVWPLTDAEPTDGRAFAAWLSCDNGGSPDYPAWSGPSGAGCATGVNAGSAFSVAHLTRAHYLPWSASNAVSGTHRSFWGFASKAGDTTVPLGLSPVVPVFVREGSVSDDPTITGADPAFLNDFTLDRIRNRYIDMPVYLATGRCPAAFDSVRGKLRDISWGLGIPEGTNDPVGTNPITRVVWGDLWVPSPDELWSP